MWVNALAYPILLFVLRLSGRSPNMTEYCWLGLQSLSQSIICLGYFRKLFRLANSPNDHRHIL